jgi:uncharacterized protein YndB with AHSA1/START domain
MEVRRDIEITGTTDEVWACLTDEEALADWVAGEGGEVHLDVRPGGTGHVIDRDGNDRLVLVERIDVGRVLEWTWWSDDDGENGEAPSTVTFTISPGVGFGRVRLTVTERALTLDGSAPVALAAAPTAR